MASTTLPSSSSGVKGRSRAERLNQILYHCFVLQLKFRFVFSFFWLSTTANTLADLLARGRELEFLATVAGSGFLRPVLRRGTPRHDATDQNRAETFWAAACVTVILGGESRNFF